MKTYFSRVVCILALSALAAKADYQVTFVTANDLSLNPVLDVDGTTRLDTTFMGQIYIGANAGSLAAVGSAVQFGTVGGTPLTAANGFIFSGAIPVTSSSVSGDTLVYQLRAWKGAATYEAALVTVGAKVGSSATTSIVVGGPPSLAAPPNTSLHGGFTLSTVAVPEPATIALGLFGAAGLLIRRRK
jgi:hypothetical protein